MIVNSDTKFFIGGTQADKVMLGTTVIWEKTTDVIVVPKPNANEIWYTTYDGKVLSPYATGVSVFGASILSNTYTDGKGVITFSGNVTKVGYNAFTGCSRLVSVNLPDTVVSIGINAFSWCSKLTDVTIPNHVTTIGDYAFASCDNIKTITIPEKVTKISYGAFQDSGNLAEVYLKPTTAPQFGSAPSTVFSGCSNNLKIYIPRGTKEQYETALDGYNSSNLVEYDY